jgi:hypothetical protein
MEGSAQAREKEEEEEREERKPIETAPKETRGRK